MDPRPYGRTLQVRVNVAGNAVAGSATLRGNAGGVVLKNNAIVGNLTICGTTGTVPPPDTGAVAVVGNTVRGRTTIS